MSALGANSRRASGPGAFRIDAVMRIPDSSRSAGDGEKMRESGFRLMSGAPPPSMPSPIQVGFERARLRGLP